MTDTPSTLTPTQAARLRAADGAATSEDAQVLSDEGIDEDEVRREQLALAAALRGALAGKTLGEDLWEGVQARLGLVEAGPPCRAVGQALAADGPVESAFDGVATAVLDALELEEGEGNVGETLRTAAGPPPDVSDGVLQALGADTVPAGVALREAAGPAPELVGALLRTLHLAGSPEGVGAALRSAAGEPPDLAGRVLDELGTSAPTVGRTLQAAAGTAPDVSEAVLGQLGLGPVTLDVGDALGKAAGAAPDLWSAVEGAVVARGGLEEGQETHPATRHPRTRVWPVLVAGALALAAAVLFYVSPAEENAEPVSLELAAINEVEIEDLTVGDDAMVQVLQFEEDAPTIIFVDVPEEAPAAGTEGTTL